MIKVKRAYEPAEENDGCRILVDRLWPRGTSKENLKLDHWFKEVAPSEELRTWFDHEPEKFDEFKHRYFKELANSDEFDTLISTCRKNGIVTLIFAAKDRDHNNAVALKEYLEQISFE